MEYLELLIPQTQLEDISNDLDNLQGVQIHKPVESRDLSTGIAILTIAANTLVLITELINLKSTLNSKPQELNIVIRNIDGDRLDIKEADSEKLKELIEKPKK